ncbi:hypothetical protein RYH80_16320 [Halobaculum sp. MBLA0147]|uniref:hypothetical protein n=1 Tax=Halobaculum sp. MBLA0147 TaxID=3079934 RepID=UPI003524EA85
MGLDLAAWIAYPAVMPNGGYLHPLGYLVALALPVLVGYVVWTDARGIVQGVVRDRTPRLVGGMTGILIAVLYAFSAGTMTFNPDDGVNAPTDAFLISYDVASPLVVWPAVQWNVPSIPFAGYLSVGSLLTMLLFGGLVGFNAAVVTQQLSGSRSIESGRLFAGTTAMTGATACCCCAPAFYGLLSVLIGTTATPIYWSFMIPASPVSGTFLSGSVLLLLWSLIRSSGGRRDTSGNLSFVDVDSTVTSRLTEE